MQARRKRGGGLDQFTLSRPEWAHYPHPLLLIPPDFQSCDSSEWDPILADQLTLFQPEGTDCFPKFLPSFMLLPMFLLNKVHLTHILYKIAPEFYIPNKCYLSSIGIDWRFEG